MLSAASDAAFVEVYVYPLGERSAQRPTAVAELNNPEWPDATFEL